MTAPLDFDALVREARAARESAALFDETARGRLRVSGRDRLKYLHNMTTQDVKSLAPGQVACACALTAKGKVVADMRLYALEDEVILDVAEGRAAALAEHLRKFVVVNQVTIEDATERLGALALEGPRAAAVLGRPLPAGVERFEEGFLAAASISGAPGCRLILPRASLAAVRARLEAAGAIPISETAADWLRVESGTPAFGKDFDEGTLPPEVGLEKTAISYTKGCYLGQEPIARLHFLGHVNRKLMGLIFEGDAPAPPRGTTIHAADGREVGRVTTPGFSVILGRPVALALIRREVHEPGTRLAAGAPGGRGAEVRALPLAP